MSGILDDPQIRDRAVPISVEQYRTMGDLGIISEKTELIRGVMIAKTNKSPQHTWLVNQLLEVLSYRLPPGFHLRKEDPLTLADSEPEPDLAVVAGTPHDYRTTHPSTAKLVIEVAVSSLNFDRANRDVYAEAGVEEYLIFSLTDGTVERYTGEGLANLSRYRPADELILQSFPEMAIKLSSLF